MTDALQTVTQIASRILVQPASELDVDAPLWDLGFEDEEWHDLLEEACDTHNVSLDDIINTMPVYRLKRSEMTLNSLSDLAAFSSRAADLVSTSTTKVNLDTLKSVAASIEQGRYVPSGLMSENLHEPSEPFWVIGKGVALTAFAVALPLLNAYGPCNPICRANCYAPHSIRFWEVGMYTFPGVLVFFALWFGPGLFALAKDHRKTQRRTGRQNSAHRRDRQDVPVAQKQ